MWTELTQERTYADKHQAIVEYAIRSKVLLAKNGFVIKVNVLSHSDLADLLSLQWIMSCIEDVALIQSIY